MLCRKHDATPRVDREAAHPSANATGKPQLAWGIEKQQHTLPQAVALAARPQADPLGDGQVLTGDSSTDGLFYMEGDGYGFDRLAGVRRTSRDRGDGPGKDFSRGTSELGEAESAGRSQPSQAGARWERSRCGGVECLRRQEREYEIASGIGVVRLAVRWNRQPDWKRKREQTGAASPKHGKAFQYDVRSEDAGRGAGKH